MEYWVTRDYGRDGKAVTLNRFRLGDFFYHLIKFKGEVKDIYTMRTDVDDSYIQVLIELPEGVKDKFVEVSGFSLEKPPTFSPA